MPDSTQQPIVILLHGFAGVAIMNRPLAAMLRRAGYRPIDLGYQSWAKSLEQVCTHLGPRLKAIDEASNAPIHFVAHSMGGLVARALIHRERPTNLGRVVMLGTPNGGSEIADFLHRQALLRIVLGQAAPALVTQRPATVDAMLGVVDYPVGIIAGNKPLLPLTIGRLVPLPSDGKVSVASTRLAQATDHITLPLPHSLLPYHSAAQGQIRAFLEQGQFAHDA